MDNCGFILFMDARPLKNRVCVFFGVEQNDVNNKLIDRGLSKAFGFGEGKGDQEFLLTLTGSKSADGFRSFHASSKLCHTD